MVHRPAPDRRFPIAVTWSLSSSIFLPTDLFGTLSLASDCPDALFNAFAVAFSRPAAIPGSSFGLRPQCDRRRGTTIIRFCDRRCRPLPRLGLANRGCLRLVNVCVCRPFRLFPCHRGPPSAHRESLECAKFRLQRRIRAGVNRPMPGTASEFPYPASIRHGWSMPLRRTSRGAANVPRGRHHSRHTSPVSC